jgi:hypothetical protein
MDANKLIWNAVDNMTKPVSNGWTEKLDRLGKQVDRLIRACATWEDKERLAREALAIACQEFEYKLKNGCDGACVICYFTEPVRDCDNDCPVCLAEYFLGRAKVDREAVENNRVVREEQEGRKAMDGEDQRREMKGGMNG